MSQFNLTNTLLSVIAVLLLVLVIQNSRSPSASRMPYDVTHAPHGQDDMPPPMPPADAPDPHVGMGEFKPTAMVFSALLCPSDKTLTLGDAACSGSDADVRRKLVEDTLNSGARLPQVFDAVVAKFGEAALTPEAIDIRRARNK